MKEGFFSFCKIIFFLACLPLIFAISLAFQTHILNLPADKEAWLLLGAGIYVLSNFFLYDLKDIFIFGQGLTSKLFGFFAPLATAASLVLPIYTATIILVYAFLKLLGREPFYEGAVLFLIGFTWMMNLVMAARQLHETDSSPLKAQYFFSFSLFYVASLWLMALLLFCVIPEFSLVAFMKSLSYHTAHLYKEVYRLLFVG